MLTTGTMLYSRYLECIYLALLKLYTHWIIIFHFPCAPCPQPSVTTIVVSASVSLTILDTSYKWNHAGFVFLCWAYFTWHTFLQVHPCCHKWQDFLPFKSWIRFHCMYTPHILLSVHLLMDTGVVSMFWSLVLEHISDQQVSFKSEAGTEGKLSHEKTALENRRSHVFLDWVGLTRYSGAGSCDPVSDRVMNLEFCKKKKAKFLLKVGAVFINGSCCRQHMSREGSTGTSSWAWEVQEACKMVNTGGSEDLVKSLGTRDGSTFLF